MGGRGEHHGPHPHARFFCPAGKFLKKAPESIRRPSRGGTRCRGSSAAPPGNPTFQRSHMAPTPIYRGILIFPGAVIFPIAMAIGDISMPPLRSPRPMKIVFRLNYHTVPGQSLWLKLATVLEDTGVRLEQVLPLRWINDRQWQAELDVKGAGRCGWNILSAASGLQRRGTRRVERPARRERGSRRDGHAASLRRLVLRGHGGLRLRNQRLPGGAARPAEFFATGTRAEDANHTFKLRMAAVPDGPRALPARRCRRTRRLGLASCRADDRGRRQCLAGGREPAG